MVVGVVVVVVVGYDDLVVKVLVTMIVVVVVVVVEYDDVVVEVLVTMMVLVTVVAVYARGNMLRFILVSLCLLFC